MKKKTQQQQLRKRYNNKYIVEEKQNEEPKKKTQQPKGHIHSHTLHSPIACDTIGEFLVAHRNRYEQYHFSNGEKQKKRRKKWRIDSKVISGSKISFIKSHKTTYVVGTPRTYMYIFSSVNK